MEVVILSDTVGVGVEGMLVLGTLDYSNNAYIKDGSKFYFSKWKKDT